ncbi:MAG TPA: thermonuclease family protein, partial [Pseudomonas sp.]|nr:thermonuclease family protein [Pseudomonas sp.]
QSPLLEVGQLRHGGFALVRGRVESVERNRGGVWLALAGPLVLHVAPQWLGRFDERVLHGLAGREIEARGWVVERGRRGAAAAGQTRWLLNLTDPAMLERH